MAHAVAHTVVTFGPFSDKMKLLSYKPVSKRDAKKILDQLEAISPYEGKEPSRMEEGFTYFENGLRVYIWTSYVASADTTRVGWDFGKVIIVESGDVVYYGPEIRRTKYFFERLHVWAVILKARVHCRPHCSTCNRLMSIFHSKNAQYYWYCENKEHEQIREKWDRGLDKILTEPYLKFLKDKRNRTKKYNKMREKMGKPKHGTARKKRRKWKYKNK